MTYPHLILIQGPPGSGKDTAADWFSHHHHYLHAKFAAPIIQVVCDLFLVEYDDLRRFKDNPIPGGTITGRQFMIDFSEEFIKPRLGADAFGCCLLRKILGHELLGPSRFVVSDSGFAAEAEPLIEHFGPERVFIIQLSRKGCSFASDSRSYWSHDGCLHIKITNGGSFDTFYAQLENALKNYSDFLPRRP